MRVDLPVPSMFHTKPPTPTPTKHGMYLVLATMLGILLSFLVHAGIEMVYLSWAEQQGKIVHWYGGCALHPVLQIGLVVIGALGGFLLGRWWWRMVYIEQRWLGKP